MDFKMFKKLSSGFSTLRRLALCTLAVGAVSVALNTTDAYAQFRAFSGGGGSNATASAASGPNLIAVQQKISAGNITVGSTAFVVVLFRNNGIAPVEVGSVNLYPSSNISASVSLNQCAKEP